MTEATEADIPRILAMGRKFHTAAGVKAPYCENTTANTVRSLIQSPDGVVFVSDAGMIGGALTSAYCASNWKIAIEMFWWSEDRRGLRMLQAFEDWAKRMGADEVRMSTVQGLDVAERILSRRGYTPSEISHGKVI